MVLKNGQLLLEFRAQLSSENLDIELSNIESLSRLSKLFEKILKKKNRGDQILIALKPPIRPNISIPLAFKVLMGFEAKLRKKNLSAIFYICSNEIVDYLYRYMPKDLIPTSQCEIANVVIIFKIADIVEVSADAIVNTSNCELKLGGGVSGSIRKSANPNAQLILNRIASNKPLKNGDAILTDALGIQRIRHIIHVAAVAGTEQVLRKSLQNILKICEDKSIRTVAIPAIGTGTGGLAMETCAKIFQEELTRHFTNILNTKIEKVMIVLWKKSDYDVFEKVFRLQPSQVTQVI